MQSPVDWKWISRDNWRKKWMAEFVIDSVVYSVYFVHDDLNVWELYFTAKVSDTSKPTVSKTGTGNAWKVYSTVIDITKSFANENADVSCIVIFSGDEDGEARFRVNRQIASKIASAIGWKFSFSKDDLDSVIQSRDWGTGFYIQKPE